MSTINIGLLSLFEVNDLGGKNMCEHHSAMDRRHFGALLLGAASLPFLPLPASAAHPKVMGVICIDYRLVGKSSKFFDEMGLNKQYDQLELAGASLAAIAHKFNPTPGAFWEQVGIAVKLHEVEKVIVVDHRDCGAYKAVFGPRYQGQGEAEMEQHRGVMKKMKHDMAHRYPNLTSEFYLMGVEGDGVDGVAEKVDV